MDALTEILRSLRLETGLVSRAVLSSPWSVHTTGTPWSIFHAILRGTAWLTVDGAAPVRLEPGDLAILPRGEPHVLADRTGVPSRHIARLPVDSDGTCIHRLVHGGGGAETEILCGSFLLRRSSAHDRLLSMLPALLRIRGDEAPLAAWLEANVALLAPELGVDQPGAGEVVARVTDVLFVRALRTWAAREDAATTGWLGALRDPRIAHALSLVHAEPDRDWTATTLAQRVGMSRTVFHPRFLALVGETPSRYVAAWRMNVACDTLDARPELSIHQVGESVGYRSEDAFCKAFRRAVGMSPAAWRRRGAAPGSAAAGVRS